MCYIGMVAGVFVLLFLSVVIVSILLSNFNSNHMGSSTKLEMSCMLRDSRID
jgi:hypothetical protein